MPTGRQKASPAGADWAGARGEQWRAHCVGMEATLAPVDRLLVRALDLDRPHRIADIGCGGGGGTFAILDQAPRGSVVHGFDISPSLIEFARDCVPAGQNAIAFEVADMATAAPPAQPFGRLASRFGIMFFLDPKTAFANLIRWLEPAGRFAFAVWGRPAENPWLTIVADAVAEVIEIPKADPTGPGLFRYGDVEALLLLLDQAGGGDLGVQDWRGALPIGGLLSPDAAATFALAAFSSFGEKLAEAGPAAMQSAHRALTTRFRGHHRDGAVRLDACVHIVTGARR